MREASPLFDSPLVTPSKGKITSLEGHSPSKTPLFPLYFEGEGKTRIKGALPLQSSF